MSLCDNGIPCYFIGTLLILFDLLSLSNSNLFDRLSRVSSALLGVVMKLILNFFGQFSEVNLGEP